MRRSEIAPAGVRACTFFPGILAVAVLAGCAAPNSAMRASRSRTEAASGGTAGLVGLTSATLQAEFGPPRILRRDGPAEIWVYRSTDCTLDLILYRDQRTGGESVAVADVLPQTAPGAASRCIAELAEAPGEAVGRVAAGR